MTNQEIAKIFYEIAEYLEIQDVPFKPQAYERVAIALESLDREVADIYKEQGLGGLLKISGVGEGIAKHLEEIIKTGKFRELEKMKKKLPVNVSELRAIEGVGPKIIKTLYQKLRVKNLADLERAARAGKIRKLPHFGEKLEAKILRGIEFLKKSRGRFLLGSILPIIHIMEERLRKISGVRQVTTAGSVRRMQETIGDIDILVTAKDPEKVMEVFTKMPEVEHIYGHGPTKTSVRLKQGIDADVRVLPEEVYGAALQYFTGDKIHNIEVRKIAIKKGYKLSEYGLFSVKGGFASGGRGKKLIAAKTEEDVYKKLGLSWMPPEIRTASGEIEAARQTFLERGQKFGGQARKKVQGLPDLIPYGSIRGDLQVQTNWTDGRASIEEMARAGLLAGLEYIAITDHTRTLAMTGGLDEKGLLRQAREIDKTNSKFQIPNSKFRILKGAEINILKDGSLDIKDKALKKLDVISAAVHTNFNMTESQMTERIIRAMKNPYLNILFHPTGRLIGKREPYKLDILKIIKAAREYGVALEVNAYPERLDLKDTHIRLAIQHGVKLVINSDAHAPHHFGFLDLGVAQVRRGWGSKNDVLNSQSVDKLFASLRSLKRK